MQQCVGDNKDRVLVGTTTSSISNRITKAKFCNLVKMSAEQQKRWELEEANCVSRCQDDC